MTCSTLASSLLSVNCDLSLSEHPEGQDKKWPIERTKWTGGRLEALAFQCDPAVPTQQWKTHCSALQEILITLEEEERTRRNFCTLQFRLQ